MKIRKRGNVTVGWRFSAPDVDAIVLLGYRDYRFRADIGREESRDGWRVRVTKVNVWKILRYGIYTNRKDYLRKEWVH